MNWRYIGDVLEMYWRYDDSIVGTDQNKTTTFCTGNDVKFEQFDGYLQIIM